jgi:hypothetical protein
VREVWSGSALVPRVRELWNGTTLNETTIEH